MIYCIHALAWSFFSEDDVVKIHHLGPRLNVPFAIRFQCCMFEAILVLECSANILMNEILETHKVLTFYVLSVYWC